ncbi:MAG: hypothetical protein QM703_19285 [Gemmatales bacterium]
MMRVFNHRQVLIATHVRRSPGHFSTLGEHVHCQKISKVESSAQELLKQTQYLGKVLSLRQHN